jgi:hypothetical protein
VGPAITRLSIACAALLLSGLAPAQDERQLAAALHERAMSAALGHPGVTVCRQLLVGIAERDWVRGEVVEVQGHLIGIRVDEPGRFPHILKGVSYHHGAVVWSTTSLWTPCL